VVDGQSYLLLIRDEGGPPEAQVSVAYGELYRPNPTLSFLLKNLPLRDLALFSTLLGPGRVSAARKYMSPSGEKYSV